MTTHLTSGRTPGRRAALLIGVLVASLLSACGSENNVVYVDDEVRPTTSAPIVVPATTQPPPLIDPAD